jgi:hypothetical protein
MEGELRPEVVLCPQGLLTEAARASAVLGRNEPWWNQRMDDIMLLSSLANCPVTLDQYVTASHWASVSPPLQSRF